MADCYLTDRQKDLLRSLMPGLKDGTVKSEWICVIRRASMTSSLFVQDGLPDELWQSVWKGVNEADFDDFENCGFFRRKGSGRYTLSVGRIIDAVENDFSEDGRVQQQNSMVDGTMIVKPTFGLPSKSTQFDCDVFMIMPFSPDG